MPRILVDYHVLLPINDDQLGSLGESFLSTLTNKLTTFGGLEKHSNMAMGQILNQPRMDYFMVNGY